MSDAGDIMTALTTDIEAAVSGVTVGLAPINFDKLAADALPHCALLLVDYAAEALDFFQEDRTWTIHGVLAQNGGTRETMQVKLEAIRDEVLSDPTLDGSVDVATCAPIVPYSHGDDARVFGEFSVQAEKVA